MTEMKTNKSYRIEVVQGYSGFDHLAPIGIDGDYPTIREARKSLEAGRKRQGGCERQSRQVRCDIVRSDGKRFTWQ
jgi:hypothetical protein